MIGLLLFAAAVPVGPGEVKSFRDWVAGCDNVMRCEAQALIPDGAGKGAVMIVTRDAGDAPVTVRFVIHDDAKPAAIAIDGKPVAATIVPADGGFALSDTDAATVLPLLLKGRRMALLDAGGAEVATVSLVGATAALLHIDDEQGRLNSVTALVRKGRRPTSTVPPAPPAPVIVQAPRGGLGPAPDAAALAALRKQTGCTQEEAGGPAESDSYVLDGARTLLLLSCGAGAYNVSTIAFIGEGGGFTPAPFDFRPGWGESAQPMLTNATWERGVLGSFSKGRGIGDCGTSEHYVWDGASFRLFEAKAMTECRGSGDWIRIWTATVTR